MKKLTLLFSVVFSIMLIIPACNNSQTTTKDGKLSNDSVQPAGEVVQTTSESIEVKSENGLKTKEYSKPCQKKQKDKIYLSSLENPTFEEMQAFYEAGYNVIGGNVEFTEMEGLLNMLALTNVKAIKGSLVIHNNPDLVTFEGLNNLRSIDGNLSIEGIVKVSTLKYLHNLQNINGTFRLISNEIHSLIGLNKLKTVGALVIVSMHNLTTLDGLNNITSIQRQVNIRDNRELTNLEGLNNITSIQDRINIQENRELINLDGLNRLQKVSNVSLKYNTKLSDFCGIKDLLINNGVAGTINFYGNKYNPSVQDIIDGNCKQ